MIVFWYYIVHVKKLFHVIGRTFPIPGHTCFPCNRDFGVMEKKKRKILPVYTPTGWIQVVRESRPRNPFKEFEMAQKDFIDIGNMKEKFTFRSISTDGFKVKLQKAMKIELDAHEPGKMFIAYTHNAGETYQEVNISKTGMLGNVSIARLYNERIK